MNYPDPGIAVNEILRQKYKDSLYEFFKEAWKVIEPDTELSENWHLEYLCEELEQILYRIKYKKPRGKDLIINIPPNTTKSSLITIIFPVWCWIHIPSLRFLTTSYSESLALTHAIKSRDIILSDWFIDLYGHLFKLKYDVNKKSEYANDKTGARIALGSGSSAIGKHGDIIIGDDPMNPKIAASQLETEKINRWWDNTISTRLRDPSISQKIIVMQRLSREDLTGHCLTEKEETYRQICLPAELSNEVKPVEIREKYVNGLLEPNRLNKIVLNSMRINLGSIEYAGQYDQIPAPLSGNLVKIEWIGRFRLSTIEELAYDNHSHLVWNYTIDGAYTENTLNAPTALLAYCYYENYMYIRDVVQVWYELPELIKMIPDWVHRNGYTNESSIYIEPKASGMPAAQMLLAQTPLNVILDREPRGDKIVRFKAKLPFIEAKRVKLLEGSPWINNYLDELKHFPHTKYKDMTDVTTMAIDRCGDYVEGGAVLGMRSV